MNNYDKVLKRSIILIFDNFLNQTYTLRQQIIFYIQNEHYKNLELLEKAYVIVELEKLLKTNNLKLLIDDYYNDHDKIIHTFKIITSTAGFEPART